MSGRGSGIGAARLLCAFGWTAFFAAPGSSQAAPTQTQLPPANEPPELDPNAPLAPMPDLGVGWPDLNAKEPAPKPLSPPGTPSAPAAAPTMDTEATGTLRYTVEVENLERLCAERGEDFAGLSRMLGRNAAYIQQFVRRGVPKRLKEEERRKLARYFAVPEALLGGPAHVEQDPGGLVSVKCHPVKVSAGPGAVVTEELGRPYFAFDERLLKSLTASQPSNLSIVRVEGDSMSPTLNAGDDILVDLGDSAERLRDGIYVLRIDDAVVVKRLALNPTGRRVTVQSDNPSYPDWPDCSLDDIRPIGRVIWSGRRIL